MRNSSRIFIGGLWILALVSASCVKTETAASGTASVTGQVVDLMCYTSNTERNSGMHHVDPVSSWYAAIEPNVSFECAYSCVRWQGQPAGIVTRDGKVYQIAGGLADKSNLKIAPHLTHTVTINGEVTVVEGLSMITANEVTMASTPSR